MKWKTWANWKVVILDLLHALLLVGLVWVIAFVWTGDVAKALTWMGLYAFVALIGLLIAVDD